VSGRDVVMVVMVKVVLSARQTRQHRRIAQIRSVSGRLIGSCAEGERQAAHSAELIAGTIVMSTRLTDERRLRRAAQARF